MSIFVRTPRLEPGFLKKTGSPPVCAGEAVIRDDSTGGYLYFREPVEIIEACALDEIIRKLHYIENAVENQGLYAAGFLSYEAAPAFDDALQVSPAGSLPLLWFGLYPKPEQIELPVSSVKSGYEVGRWVSSIEAEEYEQAIAEIKARLFEGETYQVNFSFRLRAMFSGDALGFFSDLARVQQAKYPAFVDTGRFAILSASPELFFFREQNRITCRPMKGTAPRGRFAAEDELCARKLKRSEKNRAENLMIVDMLRNDLGRIAQTGRVQVPKIFELERYPTLYQMTSTVTAETEAPLVNIMSALFPCASVTGAPKVSTMKIIARLESAPRGIYTGATGFLAPGRRAQFSVAIRTVQIDRQTGQAEYGVGSGIVWGSETDDEYAECLLKSRVLTERRPDFSLLESLRWSPAEGFFLLEYHIRRLLDSARYFGFVADGEQIRAKLFNLAASLKGEAHKVRLLVERDGAVRCEAEKLELSTRLLNLGVASEPVDSKSPFLFHKTDRRQVYEAARAACPDCDDVLLWNERGEITESTVANVVVELKNGERVTPPVSSGLLPGTFRAHLIRTGEVQEQAITLDELNQSKRIFLVNSVRGWQEAVLAGQNELVHSSAGSRK